MSTLGTLQAISNHAGQTPTQATLQASLSGPVLVDVKFWLFSRRTRASSSQPGEASALRVVNPLPVYGISLILLHTEYFRQLLSSGFAESSAETTYFAPYPTEEADFVDDYDYSSDSDLEDDTDALYDDWEVELPQPPVKRGNADAVVHSEVLAPVTTVAADATTKDSGASPSPENGGTDTTMAMSNGSYPGGVAIQQSLGTPCRQIIVKDTAFLTFRALVYCLYTGQLKFLPLRSRDPSARNATTKRLLKNRESTQEPPACSPKSMYRLAEKLGIPQLEKLALEAIQNSLTPPVILRESLTKFTSRYEPIILMELDYLCQNYTDDRVKTRWPGAVVRMLSGAYPHADQVVSMLLRDKLLPPQLATPSLSFGTPSQAQASSSKSQAGFGFAGTSTSTSKRGGTYR